MLPDPCILLLFIDDLIFPRKKTLMDMWREEWERKFIEKD